MQPASQPSVAQNATLQTGVQLCADSGIASMSAVSSATYVCSNFLSDFWLIFGKLGAARSRLCRRQFLQDLVNTRLKALDDIYKIYRRLRLLNPIWKP